MTLLDAAAAILAALDAASTPQRIRHTVALGEARAALRAAVVAQRDAEVRRLAEAPQFLDALAAYERGIGHIPTREALARILGATGQDGAALVEAADRVARERDEARDEWQSAREQADASPSLASGSVATAPRICGECPDHSTALLGRHLPGGYCCHPDAGGTDVLPGCDAGAPTREAPPADCPRRADAEAMTARVTASREQASRAWSETEKARAGVAEAQQSLRERTAEREALCERVNVLEETLARVRPDDMAPTLRKSADALVALMNLRAVLVEASLYNAGGDATDLQRRVTPSIILSACDFDLPRRLRALAEPADGPALVHEVSYSGADDALWRPGETAAECWTRHRREAEERGALWALTHWTRRPFENVHTVAGRREEAEYICAEARKAGEHG